MPGTVEVWRAAAVFVALVLFGVWYNGWVAERERRGHDQGYMGLIVALGVAATIVGWMIIVWDLWAMMYLVAAFAASGAPMIYGSIKRFIQRREHELEELKSQRRRALDEPTA